MPITKDRLELSDDLMKELYKRYKEQKEKQTYDEKLQKNVNISQATKVRVVYRKKDGTPAEVMLNCKDIAMKGLFFADKLVANTADFDILADYLKKPLLWSFELGTAYTNGIRIVFNPLFAKKLFLGGAVLASLQKSEIYQKAKSSEDAAEQLNNVTGQLFLFVIVHECYHQLYQHHRRGAIHYGTGSGKPDEKNYPTVTESDVANVAMDLEINRDIEATYPQFSGSTKAIDGMWWEDDWAVNKNTNKHWPVESWEPIYDYLIKHLDQIPVFSRQDRALLSSMENALKQLQLQSQLSLSKGENGDGYRAGWDAARSAYNNNLFDPANYK